MGCAEANQVRLVGPVDTVDRGVYRSVHDRKAAGRVDSCRLRAWGALAQTPPNQAAAQSAPPGTVDVERRGSLLLIGINRPQAQNRFDPPIIIGIGKAYYQLDHDDGLRAAVLHGIGPNFSAGVDLPAFLAGLKSGVLPPNDPDFINPFGLRPPFAQSRSWSLPRVRHNSARTNCSSPATSGWPRQTLSFVSTRSCAGSSPAAVPRFG
jgi:enoyl-CoA hydratase/isomerase-like protein